MLHHDAALGVTMVHAGLPPQWDIALARRCAAELEAALRGEPQRPAVRRDVRQPARPAGATTSRATDRLRFITNALTRLRVCDASGRLLLKFKGPLAGMPAGAMPWFRVPGGAAAGARIVCGHWSALGYLDEGGVLALDTGCVWGGALTARRLDAPSSPVPVPSTLPAMFSDS